MDVSGYTADDLRVFRTVLDQAVAEADTNMPIELMARRLFIAARNGERNKERLVAAVLGRGPAARMPPPLPGVSL
ncbi:hypothetical protein [Hyphomicrobium sp. CS1GBMeth3]|uniref:hypothetical protein n=1 Tax=Hyphomicrobium sp. CS1GBMeth3 TaxID=1892845 RepID=UPI000931D0E1|nr:hypothetical protein [Hyphomicrobium sp. CS1GBMeth3]